MIANTAQLPLISKGCKYSAPSDLSHIAYTFMHIYIHVHVYEFSCTHTREFSQSLLCGRERLGGLKSHIKALLPDQLIKFKH